MVQKLHTLALRIFSEVKNGLGLEILNIKDTVITVITIFFPMNSCEIKGNCKFKNCWTELK